MTEAKVPLLVAHRGWWKNYPENTWASLEAALRAGACWLEFDLQRCADGRFILLHDADFQRTADRAGNIFTTGSAALDTFSVHEPARLGQRFAPLPPSTLEDVMQRLGDYPDARAMVEIKTESLQHWGLDTVVDELLRALAPYRHRCMLISFSHAALERARRGSDIDIGWVLQRYDAEHLLRAEKLQPQLLACNYNKIPQGVRPAPGTWQWMLYDISDPERALHWAGLGVELIETGDIGNMLQHPLLATRACRHGR